jgi:hypothetical protein
VRANPVGWEAAHNILANVNNIAGLLSVTKGSGSIVNCVRSVSDWKAGVSAALINAWILHRHNLVLFTRGGKDYAAQNDWHNSRSRQERDEFRVWAMGKVEAGLTASDRLLVHQARQTVKPVIAGECGTANEKCFWTRDRWNIEMNTGRFGAHNDANGTNPGASEIHRLATRAERAQQGRKRDREDEDDNDKDQG